MVALGFLSYQGLWQWYQNPVDQGAVKEGVICSNPAPTNNTMKKMAKHKQNHVVD